MVKNQLPVIAAILLVVGIRLYMKYVKKNKAGTGKNTNQTGNTFGGSSSKEDDYEPYSKK